MKRVIGKIAAVLLLCSAAAAQEAGPKTWNDGVNEYVPLGSELVISADSIPEGAGSVVYMFNSPELQEYTAPIVFTEEGQAVVAYAAKNVWGEISNMQMYVAFVDGTAPNLKYMLSGPFYMDAAGSAYVTDETGIKLYGEDAISGTEHVFISLNGGEEVDVVNSSVMYFNGMEDGEVGISGYAVDFVGNVSETIELSVSVDTKAPVLEFVCTVDPMVIDGVTYVSPAAEISLNVSDELSGVKDIFVSINDSDFTRYQDVIIPMAGMDSYVIKAYAVDNVGNQSEPAEMSFSTNLALSAPAAECFIPGGEPAAPAAAEGQTDGAAADAEMTDGAEEASAPAAAEEQTGGAAAGAEEMTDSAEEAAAEDGLAGEAAEEAAVFDEGQLIEEEPAGEPVAEQQQ